jgi:transaldolase
MSRNALLDLPIKIFAEGAGREELADLSRQPFVHGLTTNRALIGGAGFDEYAILARQILDVVEEKPISFEMLSEDFPEMRRQARAMSKWRDNVYVRIPISNSRGESAIPLIKELAADGVQLNVTDLTSRTHVETVALALSAEADAIVSVLAGRIADRGIDPMPLMKESLELLSDLPSTELLWASVREVLNIFQAAACGCHIVTAPRDILAKVIKLGGMNLDALSVDTVRMFHDDAVAAGFSL